MTDVIRVDPINPDAALIARAAESLWRGGLVAFPTETVYGLGVHALDRGAVRRVFEAKRRPTQDPLIVHVGTLADASALVASLPKAVEALARRFWPGPLTLVMRRAPIVPDEVTAGLETVGIRLPAHPVAQALIRAAAIPIAAPSANLFSRPSPTSADHVLHDLSGRIDLIIDAGPTTIGLESTVLDLSGERPTVLRPGAVTLEMLREILPDVQLNLTPRPEPSAPLRAPGLLSKHYSPKTPLTLYEGEPAAALGRLMWDARTLVAAGGSVGVAATDEDLPQLSMLAEYEGVPGKPALRIARLGTERDLETVAANLYSALRELDASGVEVIFVRSLSGAEGLGTAIGDRLHRAAAGRIVGS